LVERRRSGLSAKSEDANKWLEPAPPRKIVEELTRLRMVTKAKDPGEDLDLLVTAYAERMAEYPLDIICETCREIADKSTFFPAWAELKAALDDWMNPRREIVAGLNKLKPALPPYNPPPLLADLLTSGEVKPMTDDERSWLAARRTSP
jgi:hypothetical protein